MVVRRMAAQVFGRGKLKPIRHRIVKHPIPITRIPHEEPLTPGLRRPEQNTNAIGFTANIVENDDDE